MADQTAAWQQAFRDVAAEGAQPPKADIGDVMRFAELGEMAETAASLWFSIALSCGRHSRLTAAVHLNQVLLVTKAALATMSEFGQTDVPP
jgi:hypothetical protein